MAFQKEQGATRRDSLIASPPVVASAALAPFRGYFRPEDIAADRWVHFAALILCTIGIPVLLHLAGRSPDRVVLFACSAYAVTLVMLFVCSTTFYHVPLRVERRRLRQLDHAAIFLVIAGTCTPFTATLLPGDFAVAITALVWLGGVSGAAYKLRRPLQFPGFSTAGYRLTAATILVGLVPVLWVIDPVSLVLVVAGLVIYALGVVIRVRRSWRYRNTIWHVMVLAAAACHYAAILHGVVLAPGVLR